MLISESLWGVWNMILVQFLLQIVCRFGYTSWCIHCIPSSVRWKRHHVKMQPHGLGIPTRIFSAGTGLDWLLDMGAPHPHPPKAVFFYVANKIFVTCSTEAHITLLINCGIKSTLIFIVIFPYWLNAPDSLFLLCWHASENTAYGSVVGCWICLLLDWSICHCCWCKLVFWTLCMCNF
jgi:hypothetical protein